MSIADDLLAAGDITGARSALVDIVRSDPSSVEARLFLFQLLAVAGEWEKARTQLNALSQLSPEAKMLSVAYGNAIDAEKQRAAVFAGEQPPVVMTAGSGWLATLAEAWGHFAAGRIDAGDAARTLAFGSAPDTPGTLDGERFDWIADSDARFGPAFEAIIAGQWGLVPFEAVERIESEGPSDLRDLVWLPATVAFRTGSSAPALLPVRYPGSEHAGDSDLALARATQWREGSAGETGLGQHLWSLSSGEERPLLSLRRLVFD